MPLPPEGRVVIVGAGPCGLACARELERLGHRKWTVLERSGRPGGLAASVRDGAGFTWDLGGHVVFSHFGEFDALLAEVMGGEVLRHDRSSFVRFADRWVPYPFQNNLHHLPDDVRDECLEGLARATGAGAAGSAGADEPDFGSWMLAVFGEGITRHFMAPYNLKVWATPAQRMSAGWIAERVSVVDHERLRASAANGRDDLGWGANASFVFPAQGGTGEIYRRLAARLGERVRYGVEAATVDPERRVLRTAAGEQLAYDALVSTMPLQRLVAALAGAPPAVRAAGAELVANGVYMVGVGYEAPLADSRSWMYFPDPAIPFYRATNFAKYSPANVPGADTSRYCSYMTETAFSASRPVAREGLEEAVERGLRAAGVVTGRPPVASLHLERIDCAYPVPTLGRDRALREIQPWLMAHAIYSRGRLGSWRYEAGNMDHAVKMGIDAARALLTGTGEELWTL
jgi:protoporphyrinogen oxidase